MFSAELETDKAEINRQIGRTLEEARTSQRITITTCARAISTSRRRYAAIEAGEAMLGLPEAMVLASMLSIGAQALWPSYEPIQEQDTKRVVIQIPKGQSLQVVIENV